MIPRSWRSATCEYIQMLIMRADQRDAGICSIPGAN